jgi:hypothetical protein
MREHLHADHEKAPKHLDDFSQSQIEFLKIQYGNYCEDWRHYDNHVWQIPSLAVTVNAFLVGQAFNPIGSGKAPVDVVRILLLLAAGLFTFVLLIALVKHRLHQCAKDYNKRQIEAIFSRSTSMIDFNDLDQMKKAEPHPYFLERWLAPRKTNKWLMAVMGFTVFMDICLLAGILLGKW